MVSPDSSGQQKEPVAKRLAKGVIFDTFKELGKLALIGLATSLGSPILSVVGAYFSDSTLGKEPSGQFTWRQFFIDVFENPLPGTLQYFLFGELWRTILVFGLLGFFTALVIFLWRDRRQVRAVLRGAAYAEQVLATIGFHAVVMPEMSRAAWEILLADIKDARTHALFILGASGWETFAGPQSPLYSAVSNFKGEVRILLMDTNSLYLEARASTVNTQASAYRKEIQDSQAFVNQLKQRGNKVDLRLYRDPLSWKLIITPNYCWVQYYALGAHVQQTPAYLFFNSAHQASFYHLFSWEFSKIWDGAARSRNRH